VETIGITFRVQSENGILSARSAAGFHPISGKGFGR
jgi:hypothetical protein